MQKQTRKQENENHYNFVPSYFTKESLKGGRNFTKIKNFFDAMSKNIFATHLKIYQDIGELPFIYNERSGYAAIASSLHKLSPYVMSEYSLSCKDNDRVQNANTRSVDFWYMDESGAFEIYIESKHIHQSLQSIEEGKITELAKGSNSYNESIIKNGLTQVDDCHKLETHKFTAECQTLGLMLLSLSFYKTTKQKKDSIPTLDATQEATLEQLESYIDNRRYMGILCSGIDLQNEINKKIKKKEFHCFGDEESGGYGYYQMPYLLLIGFILDMPK